MKLITKPGLFKSQKILIAAQYAQVYVDVEPSLPSQAIDGDLSPYASLPLLETPDGIISESNAIARYIAALRPESKIYGEKGLFQAAQIDSWIDFCSNNLDIPVAMWTSLILGAIPYRKELNDKAMMDLRRGMMTLENHLRLNTFIVGRCVTLADISIACTLLLPLKLTLDETARSEYPSIIRWFDTCVHQAEFASVLGEVTLCKTPLIAAPSTSFANNNNNDNTLMTSPENNPNSSTTYQNEKKKQKESAKRKEPEPKAAKEGNDEEEIDEALVEKKVKNPLDSLPKSSFSLDGWKREYSNAPGGDCYSVMPYLWQNFDAAGYSIFIQRYKYNEELTVSYKTSNLVGGFIQRAEEMRKYAFGVMQILGQEGGPMEIVGAWIIRGDSVQAMADSNPDTDSYAWEKITDLNDANKQKIADLFCAWETIEGKKIMDCKVFK